MTKEPVLFVEVLQCFARFPQRHDTLHGVARWWLLENRIEWAVREVQAALDALVEQGLVVATAGADGQVRYKVNADSIETVEQLLQKQKQQPPPQGTPSPEPAANETRWDAAPGPKPSP